MNTLETLMERLHYDGFKAYVSMYGESTFDRDYDTISSFFKYMDEKIIQDILDNYSSIYNRINGTKTVNNFLKSADELLSNKYSWPVVFYTDMGKPVMQLSISKYLFMMRGITFMVSSHPEIGVGADIYARENDILDIVTGDNNKFTMVYISVFCKLVRYGLDLNRICDVVFDFIVKSLNVHKGYSIENITRQDIVKSFVNKEYVQDLNVALKYCAKNDKFRAFVSVYYSLSDEVVISIGDINISYKASFNIQSADNNYDNGYLIRLFIAYCLFDCGIVLGSRSIDTLIVNQGVIDIDDKDCEGFLLRDWISFYGDNPCPPFFDSISDYNECYDREEEYKSRTLNGDSFYVGEIKTSKDAKDLIAAISRMI